jgi:uncharacterized protein (DUF1015 family)
MNSARAFGYLRYTPDVVGDVGRLLAPPYDVMSEEDRAGLAESSEFQSVHLELPAGNDQAGAAALLQKWIDESALELGEVGVVVVKQRFTGPDGVRRERVGVLCEVGLRPFDSGEVLPHERTFPGPTRTRRQLMEATGANISPVFLLYHDPSHPLEDLVASVTDDEPDVTAHTADGTQVAAWYVQDASVCELFERAVAEQRLLIADGHHRYTAALEYQELAHAKGPKLSLVGGTETALPPHTDSSGPDGVLAFVANSADPGIVVFPTHRVAVGVDPKLLDEFVVGSGALADERFDDVDAAMRALDASQVPGFVALHGDVVRLLTVPEASDLELAAPELSPASRDLDVVALHALVLDGGAVLAEQASELRYTRSRTEAEELVRDDPRAVAFLLREAAPAQVHAVAEAGDLLPQKSTYFYPKVPTGLAYRLLGDR